MKYYLGEKNTVINCVYIMVFFYNGVILTPWYCLGNVFHGTRAGLMTYIAHVRCNSVPDLADSYKKPPACSATIEVLRDVKLSMTDYVHVLGCLFPR